MINCNAFISLLFIFFLLFILQIGFEEPILLPQQM